MVYIYCEIHAKRVSGSALCGKMQRPCMLKQMARYHWTSHWTYVLQYDLLYIRFDHMVYLLISPVH